MSTAVHTNNGWERKEREVEAMGKVFVYVKVWER